ncbi:MAG: Serine/threonine protein kinase PrkC, regulator of stationary phase [Labilithrix sp.]|nr:Serine/threonine protein kinase PrkC, regulator of stationary phase [Labilithrix sp.]
MMVTPSVKLVRPLGEGGMGAVWVAEHLALHTQVVVKFIASGLTGSKEAQDRFSREAAAASQVKSPHVVQTFDHGITDDGVPYIVMELLEGRDLGQYLEVEAKVPPDLVVEIVGQLARALDRAHEKGIIHRDIKPGNIYLCDVGRSGEVFVKLLDFGIAKGVETSGIANRVDSGTKTGSMIGSPFYMSPEQILGSKDIDHRSDLWSVGVVTYEMLTGRKPFDAETMGGLAIRIHSEPLPIPTDANPDLSPAVDAWFARACARDVNARYASANELAVELARALGGQVPKSIDGAPRLSTGSSGKRVDPVAATLVAGAATDAGVVRSHTQSRSRSRLLVLLAIFVVVPPMAFVGFRAFLKKDTATALVPSDHVATASGAANPSSTASATLATTVAASTTASVTPPVEAASAAAATTKPPARGTRGRPPATPSSAHAVAASSSPLPSPPVTSTPTPRPATSGHDIF